MKFNLVADESVDFRIVTELRRSGAEVFAVCEEQPAITDDVVLSIATEKNAILLTEDKDFGELVFRLRLPHKGILLIRIENADLKIAKVVETILTYYEELQGRFSVINEKKLRIKE